MTAQIQTPAGLHPAIARLQVAINRHDLDAMVSCFHPDVVSDQPAHPARGFKGTGQLRQNWATIFGGVPDLGTDILRATADGDTVWTEWVFRGTRVDGEPFHLRGVILQGLRDDLISSVTFYMEPVDGSGERVAASVRAAVGAER
jgi:ketosteroid isomerase-like protein